MKKIILCLFLILGFAALSEAQTYTTVTSTVTDPNGVVYALGTYGVTLVNTSGQQPLLGGNANFQQNFSGVSLTAAGTLSIVLPSVTAMTPSSGLQWKFSICANPGQIASVFPPAQLPCFTYTSTGTLISGSTVDLSTQMKSVATIIPVAAASGSGTVSSCGAAGNAYYSAAGTTVVCDTSVTDNGSGTVTAATLATSGSNGGFTGTEGTGAALTAGAGTDLLWPDSTAHRLKMNNNNAGGFNIPGVSAAATSGHLATYAANGIDLVDGGAVPSSGVAKIPINLPVAVCQGSGVSIGGSGVASTLPATVCLAGSTTQPQTGVQVYAQSTLGTLYVDYVIQLPAAWTSIDTVSFKVYADTAITGTAYMNFQYVCVADLSSLTTSPTYAAVQQASATVPGTTGQAKTLLLTAPTISSCAAGNIMYIRIGAGTGGGVFASGNLDLVAAKVELH